MRIKFHALCFNARDVNRNQRSCPDHRLEIFAELFVSGAHAQHGDWQKVDETLGRKPI